MCYYVSHGGDVMELESVSSNGYQGSNANTSTKPVKAAKKTEVSANEVEIEPVVSSIVKGLEKKSGNGNDTDAENTIQNANNINIKQSVSMINSKLNNNTECIFGIHDETNRVMIKIVDRDTKEVIKEIPPEKTLEMITKLWEFAGILVDEKL